jgi:hypothetical protein
MPRDNSQHICSSGVHKEVIADDHVQIGTATRLLAADIDGLPPLRQIAELLKAEIAQRESIDYKAAERASSVPQ